MPELFQDVVVTLVAVWAAWVIVRRVTAVVTPGPKRSASCDNCASSSAASKGDAGPKPLTLVRDRRP